MTRSIPKLLGLLALTATILSGGTADAAYDDLTVALDGLDGSGRFADRSAFCPPPGGTAKDVSPGVTWSKGPPGTRSYILLMNDPDVPADLTLINKPGVIIPLEAPRIRVFHWVLADIPPSVTSIPAGVESEGLTPGGKPIGPTDHGLRGANVFTTFLAQVTGMAGVYGGYDGPCPPANDKRVHHYIVDVFALDVATLGLSGAFTGEDAEKSAAGHILARGRAIGTYALGLER